MVNSDRFLDHCWRSAKTLAFTTELGINWMLVYCKRDTSLLKSIHIEISKFVLCSSNNKFTVHLVELVLGNFQVELQNKGFRTK